MSMRNVGGDGKSCLGNRVQLPPIPAVRTGRLRPEKQRPLLKVTQPGPGSNRQIRRHSPYRGLIAC